MEGVGGSWWWGDRARGSRRSLELTLGALSASVSSLILARASCRATWRGQLGSPKPVKSAIAGHVEDCCIPHQPCGSAPRQSCSRDTSLALRSRLRTCRLRSLALASAMSAVYLACTSARRAAVACERSLSIAKKISRPSRSMVGPPMRQRCGCTIAYSPLLRCLHRCPPRHAAHLIHRTAVVRERWRIQAQQGHQAKGQRGACHRNRIRSSV
jgi:hypothetical protein